MGWPVCNSTLEEGQMTEPKLFDGHSFTFHQLTLAVSAPFGLFAIVVSLSLMYMHSIRYSRPREQRHIIRILFMVPIYAMVSFLSIIFYVHSVYYDVLRDCYEAFAIASFFSLLCSYLADDLHQQKDYFRKVKPKPWILPLSWFVRCTGGENGLLKTPRSGLTWFNIIWVAVFQYCFIRVSMTFTAVITQHFRRYCLESLNPAFAHVWVMCIEAIAVSITMYCIIQFYIQIRRDIAQHKPVLKVLAIKLVIFLSFWQTILISFLTSSGAIKASDKIQTPDIKVSIPAMLLCIEMAIFSVFHWWSFSYKPYVIGSKQFQETYGHLVEEAPEYHGGAFGIKAILDCFNPWDIIKATARSGRWLFVGHRRRENDISYATVGDSQKMSDLDASTSYAGVGSAPTKRHGDDEADLGLLATAQKPAHDNPFETRESDSSNNSTWTEVEAKEYLQDQRMRNQNPRRDDFGTAQVANPYTAAYQETQYPPRNQRMAPGVQETGVLRPAGTDQAGRMPNLPMDRGQDTEHMRNGQAPYPRSMASTNVRGPAQQQTMMPPLPSQRRDDGFI